MHPKKRRTLMGESRIDNNVDGKATLTWCSVFPVRFPKADCIGLDLPAFSVAIVKIPGLPP